MTFESLEGRARAVINCRISIIVPLGNVLSGGGGCVLYEMDSLGYNSHYDRHPAEEENEEVKRMWYEIGVYKT